MFIDTCDEIQVAIDNNMTHALRGSHDMTFYYAAARPDHALTADHATIPYI